MSNKPEPRRIEYDVSSLDEGEARLQWPAPLSAESVQDLEAWLGLVVQKLKRRYACGPRAAGEKEPQ